MNLNYNILCVLCRYFKCSDNLLKVRNIVCTYVWDHLSEGYSQGMCDLVAPLLVVTDNEVLAYACFVKLMEGSSKLFPPSSVMNTRLANVKSLLQVCVNWSRCVGLCVKWSGCVK